MQRLFTWLESDLAQVIALLIAFAASLAAIGGLS